MDIEELLPVYPLDDVGAVIYIQIPDEHIVSLQGIVETYEELGAVRTVDRANSFVSFLTTKDLAPLCRAVLMSERERFNWQPVSREMALKLQAIP